MVRERNTYPCEAPGMLSQRNSYENRPSTYVTQACDPTVPELERAIRSIVAQQLETSWMRVLPGSRFVEDLGADSMDLLQIIVEIEEELDIVIADEAAEHFTCVGDVQRYLELQREVSHEKP